MNTKQAQVPEESTAYHDFENDNRRQLSRVGARKMRDLALFPLTRRYFATHSVLVVHLRNDPTPEKYNMEKKDHVIELTSVHDQDC